MKHLEVRLLLETGLLVSGFHRWLRSIAEFPGYLFTSLWKGYEALKVSCTRHIFKQYSHPKIKITKFKGVNLTTYTQSEILNNTLL